MCAKRASPSPSSTSSSETSGSTRTSAPASTSARETTTEEYSAIFVFDSVTRTSRQLAPPRNEGPDHRTIARPFGEVGFKAYMTRRAFFTADTRLMYRKGLDEVLFRLGFGIDF